jgi:hypothetical protein
MNKKEILGLCEFLKLHGYENTDNISKFIFGLQKENKQLKDELKSKPDAQITLQDDKGNKFMVIQTERIDMQVELNKTIEKLFNNWNELKEYIDIKLYNVEYLQKLLEQYQKIEIVEKVSEK